MMFSDISVAHGIPVRRWTAIASYSLQAAMVAAALIYPLLRMETLPPLPRTISLPFFVATLSSATVTAVPHGGSHSITAPIVVNTRGISFQPSATPSSGGEIASAPDIGSEIYGTGAAGGPIVGTYTPPIPIISSRPQSVHTSVVMEGNLIHRVDPQYPPIAKQLRVEGPVVIRAWITRDGVIEREQVESGHPMLARAALEAVRQWRYRPYYLNHEPVEVETEITVNFVLR